MTRFCFWSAGFGFGLRYRVGCLGPSVMHWHGREESWKLARLLKVYVGGAGHDDVNDDIEP